MILLLTRTTSSRSSIFRFNQHQARDFLSDFGRDLGIFTTEVIKSEINNNNNSLYPLKVLQAYITCVNSCSLICILMLTVYL